MKLVAYDATWGEKPNERELVQSRIVSKNQQDLPKQRMLDSYSEVHSFLIIIYSNFKVIYLCKIIIKWPYLTLKVCVMTWFDCKIL